MEWVEGFGDSVEAAKEIALEGLGVHEDDAEIEVLNDVKFGLFNRVKEKARVRARVRPATPRSKDDRRRRRGKSGNGSGQSSRSNQPASAKKRGGSSGGSNRQKSAQAEKKPEKKAEKKSDNKNQSRKNENGREANRNRKSGDKDMDTMTLTEQADLAEAFVTGLATEFGESVTFERTEVDEAEIRIVVDGENLGRMIGRRAATANAIDELVRTVLQRQAGGGREGRVRIDIGGVAGRREDALREFCVKIAEQVRDSGKEVSLEPMRGSDRKVVHDAMTSEDGVDTISEGEDPNRRVVVVPAENDD